MIDTADIEILKTALVGIGAFVVGMVAEGVRRWFAAPATDRDEFIDSINDMFDPEGIKGEGVALGEALAVMEEGIDIFMPNGVYGTVAPLNTEKDIGKA